MVTIGFGAVAGSYAEYIKLFMDIITGLVVAGTIFRCLTVGISYLSGEQPLEELLKKLRKIIMAAILCGSVPQVISMVARAYGN